jgi:malonyl-CoA O-methyltransferase
MSHTKDIFSAPGFSVIDYAKCAVFANSVGEEVLERLSWVKMQPRVILDVGCSTGNFTQKLQALYPQAQVVGTDAAYSMVGYARAQAELDFVCADATLLPLKNQSVDLIFANMVLPWCGDVKTVLQEWRRVLRSQGLLVFTALGPDTLGMWRDKFGGNIIPACVDMHDLGDALTQGKFAEPIMDVDYFTLHYRSAAHFCRELEVTGMLLPVPPDAFGESRDVYPAVFEVVHGHAWRPDASADQTADAEGVVRVPLAHLRGRR